MNTLLKIILCIISITPITFNVANCNVLNTGYNKSKLHESDIEYKKLVVDGLDIFYREAGKANKRTIVLLHGFPSSSHMYRDLINDLSDSYHVIAPDYPGFGQSSSPIISQYEYTFENISITIEYFLDELKLDKVSLYLQDYGGPIGMRIATRRPEIIESIIIQNANAYVQGLGGVLEPLTNYIKNPNAETEKAARFFLTLEATKWQYLNGAENPNKISPDSYITDQYYLNRPNNDQIQLALFRDYGSNINLYEKWQLYFKDYQPHTLVIWGKNDEFFITPGAFAYRKDNPKAIIQLVNGGHFALEEHHKEISKLIKKFINKTVKKSI